MLKKITLLAMAVAALAVFVLPAVASANWKDSGVEVKTNATITATGTEFKFTSVATGAITCHVVLEGTLTASSTAGDLTKFEPLGGNATANCTTGGVIANEGCVIESVTATELPWNLTDTGTTITVATRTIDIRLVKKGSANVLCQKFPGSDFTAGTLTFTPDKTTAISTLTLSGSLKFDPGSIPLTFSGTFDVTPAATYGL
jgi:hypothetical protein